MVDMGNVWDRTSQFLRDNVGAWMPIALVAMLLPNIISVLAGGAGPAVDPIIVQGYALVCALIALWGQLAVVALALDPDGGRSRAMATATGNMGRAVGAMAILLAIVLILAAPIVGLLLANGLDLTAMRAGGVGHANLAPGTAMFVSIYSIVLTVAVLFVAVRLALLYPVIVGEGGVIAAIRRAWALTRGMVWKMIGVWLLFVIVYLVAAAAVTSGIGTVIGLLADMRNALSPGRIVVAVLSGIVTTAFTLIVAAFSAELYRAVTSVRAGVAVA